MTGRSAKLSVHRSTDGQFYVRLTAANGEPLMHSETYTRAADAMRSRQAIMRAFVQVLAGRIDFGIDGPDVVTDDDTESLT